jgi:hypothetical protein
MNRNEQPDILKDSENYSLGKTTIEAITNESELPKKLKQLDWPLELQGAGKTTSEENKEFKLKFPVGDIFLSYATTIHELGHLRQESLNSSLKNISNTHEVLYAQEQDAWERGWNRFITANPDLIETLNKKFEAYKSQGKLEFDSFKELYNWIKQMF